MSYTVLEYNWEKVHVISKESTKSMLCISTMKTILIHLNVSHRTVL